MKQKIISKLALVAGVLLISQSGLAMKRTNSVSPGRAAELTVDTVSTLVAVVSSWLQAQAPHEANAITLVSNFGTQWSVPLEDLNALMSLSPTIAALIDDMQGQVSTIPLSHVSNPAIYLLTQMAERVERSALLDYIRRLSAADVEKLKNDAQHLESAELKDLIAEAVDSPYAALPNECLFDIFRRIGPQGRLMCWSVDRKSREFLDGAQAPVSVGGFGWTDVLTVVETIKVGRKPSEPVVFGSCICVSNEEDGSVEVIDSNAINSLEVDGNQNAAVVCGSLLYVTGKDDRTISVIDNGKVIKTIHLEEFELCEPVFLGKFLYVVDYWHLQVIVIDPAQNYEVIRMIQFDLPHAPVAFNSLIYLSEFGESTVLVLDPAQEHELVHTIEVGKGPLQPVVFGRFLYVTNEDDGTVSVIDTHQDHQVVQTIDVGNRPFPPVVWEALLYVSNYQDDTVSVIDPAQNHQVVQTIQVGRGPQMPVGFGSFLFVANKNDGSVAVIDSTQYHQVIRTVPVGREPLRPVVLGSHLYVTNREDDTVSVIDLGGYLPDIEP